MELLSHGAEADARDPYRSIVLSFSVQMLFENGSEVSVPQTFLHGGETLELPIRDVANLQGVN